MIGIIVRCSRHARIIREPTDGKYDCTFVLNRHLLSCSISRGLWFTTSALIIIACCASRIHARTHWFNTRTHSVVVSVNTAFSFPMVMLLHCPCLLLVYAYFAEYNWICVAGSFHRSDDINCSYDKRLIPSETLLTFNWPSDIKKYRRARADEEFARTALWHVYVHHGISSPPVNFMHCPCLCSLYIRFAEPVWVCVVGNSHRCDNLYSHRTVRIAIDKRVCLWKQWQIHLGE